ncbi:hypothetical protein [Roseinatronobacter alkalisoli]|uniref:Peptidase S14 n=1 Tax=Roseinatronobacter alkalisoli TaxID=3028235 RepID=A0ABT5TBI9_9RHOB|nr:hypothetical protein [Roseinatronobacter sp. HJB301]MDD7972477.1 hypothetical protein [Roseinatronobacter sp. HJB301]
MTRWLHNFLKGDAVLVSILVLSLSGLAVLGAIVWRAGAPVPAPLPTPPPAYTLSVSEDEKSIRIEGAIELGITAALSELLDDIGDVGVLELQSGGGRVPEARGLIRLVTEHQLATVARGDCLSTCALVFMAGSPRRMEDGARLGFHSYALNMPVVSTLMDVSAEQARDMAGFLARGIDGAFLDRIVATPPENMWFPSRHLLLEAGVLTEPPVNAADTIP